MQQFNMFYKKKASIQLLTPHKIKNEQQSRKKLITLNNDIRNIMRPHTQDTQNSQFCGKMVKYPKSEVKFKQQVKILGLEVDQNKEALKKRVDKSKKVAYKQFVPSIGKIICPSEKSLKYYSSCKNSKKVSKHIISGKQNENQLFKRNTFKMLSLKWQSSQNDKSNQTINNTLKSFRNNKFRQTEDNTNYYKNKKQKQVKIRSCYDKQAIKTAENENEQLKQMRREKKRKTKCIRNSRFSLKNQQIPLNILNSECQASQSKNDKQLTKTKAVKFIQMKQFGEMSKYNKLKAFKFQWKHWKKSQRHIHFNSTTINNQRNTAAKQIENQFKTHYQQKFRAKQNQLHHINKLHQNLNKIKANQHLIQSFTYEHKKQIDNLFNEFEHSVTNYSKLLRNTQNELKYEQFEQNEKQGKKKLRQAKYQLQYKNM